MGTAAEVARRTVGMSNSSSIVADNPLLTEANVERIVNTLCTVRGAALKIGQIISLQGEESPLHCTVCNATSATCI